MTRPRPGSEPTLEGPRRERSKGLWRLGACLSVARQPGWVIRSCMVLLAMVGTIACQDLKRFEPKPGETYCGSLVGSPAFHDGLLPDGVPPVLLMQLELQVSELTQVPGYLSTGDAQTGLCSATAQPLFERAPLRAIPTLAHDELSFLEFGEGRELNLLSWVDSTCQGTFLVVLSLMKSGSVEVRLLKPKPMPAPQADAAQRPGFGLFHLSKKPISLCSF